jgi:hypothetical protein
VIFVGSKWLNGALILTASNIWKNQHGKAKELVYNERPYQPIHLLSTWLKFSLSCMCAFRLRLRGILEHRMYSTIHYPFWEKANKTAVTSFHTENAKIVSHFFEELVEPWLLDIPFQSFVVDMIRLFWSK